MYLNHYNLKEKPFELGPGPRFLWLGEKHLEALATLKYGITQNKGFLLLTGDIGMGKTALIHRLLKEIDESKVVAYIPNPRMEFLDFFNFLSNELGMGRKFASKGAFLMELKKFLQKKHTENTQVLLVIDESQRLDNELLEEIRLLSNIELENKKLINIFFVGQIEFNRILKEPHNRALRQRIALRYQVEPLDLQETANYIMHRLKVAGAAYRIFKLDAIHEIYRFSKGCPRLINIISDHALLTGYTAEQKLIDSNIIKECAKELKLPQEFDETDFLPAQTKTTEQPLITIIPDRKPTSWNHLLRIGGFIIFSGVLVYFLFWPASRRTKPILTPQELMAPLSEKNQAISENGSKSIQVTDDTQGRAPTGDESENKTTYSEQTAAKPENFHPSTDLPNLTRPGSTELGAPSQDIRTGKNEQYASSQVTGELDNTSKGLLNQTDTEKKKINAENSRSLSDVGVSEPVLSTSETTGNEKIEESGTLSNEPPLPSKSTALANEKDADFAETTKRVEPPKTLVAILPQTAKKVDDEKPAAENKIPQVDQDTVKKVDGETPPAKKEGPQPEQDSFLTLSRQKEAQDLREKKPDVEEAEKPTQIIEERSLAKADPSSENKPPGNQLESRIRSFLQYYSSTYAAKELNNFAVLFSPGAKENDKPFATLLPKYQKNFGAIDKIQYRIDLQKYDYNKAENIVEIEGRFLLKWLPYGQDWRENSGKIFMRLNESGQSFKVQSLDYFGDRSNNRTDSGSSSP